MLHDAVQTDYEKLDYVTYGPSGDKEQFLSPLRRAVNIAARST